MKVIKNPNSFGRYNRGDLLINEDGDVGLIVQVGYGTFSVICLDTANRWFSPEPTLADCVTKAKKQGWKPYHGQVILEND